MSLIKNPCKECSSLNYQLRSSVEMLDPDSERLDDTLESCRTYLDKMIGYDEEPEPRDVMREMCSRCPNLSVYFDKERMRHMKGMIESGQSVLGMISSLENPKGIVVAVVPGDEPEGSGDYTSKLMRERAKKCSDN